MGQVCGMKGGKKNTFKVKVEKPEGKESLGRPKHKWIIHSFHCHLKNARTPCRSQELLPFLSVMYFFLPPFSTNYSSILSHLILPSISWSPLNLIVPKFIYNTLLGILFSSILCTCSNQRNLFNLIVLL